MSWGAFAGGFAKTFDPRLVGGAINEGYAQAGYDDKMAEAKKYEDQLAELDAQRSQKALDTTSVTQAQQQVAGQAIPTGQAAPQQSTGPQSVMTQNTAIPTGTDYTQPVNTQVGDMSNDEALSREGAAAALREKAPPKMSQLEYEQKAAELNLQKRQANIAAKQEYYKRRGMTEKAAELDDEADRLKWHGGMMKQYYGVLNGDQNAIGPVLKYVNTLNGDGSQYVAAEGGGYNLVGPDGKVLQQNVQFTPQQIRGAFRQYYAAAEMARSGDFDKYMKSSMQEEELALKHANHAETVRSHKANEKHQAGSLALQRKQYQFNVAKELANQRRLAQQDEIAAQERERKEAERVRKANLESQKANWEAHKTESEIAAQEALVKERNARAKYLGGAKTDQTVSQTALTTARAHEVPLNSASKRNVDAARVRMLDSRSRYLDGKGNPTAAAAKLGANSVTKEQDPNGNRFNVLRGPDKRPIAVEFAHGDKLVTIPGDSSPAIFAKWLRDASEGKGQLVRDRSSGIVRYVPFTTGSTDTGSTD
jgi:hypothetical protein